MKVIMQPKHLKLDDGHCAPVLVQLVVQGADSSRMEDLYTKFVIHWLWKVHLSPMVDVHRNEIEEHKNKTEKFKSVK